MPLADLYHRKKLGIPWMSFFLLINCILVTVAIALYPGLQYIFGADAPNQYPWIIITTLFVHGWPEFPWYLHLGGNLVALLSVTVLVERTLGVVRLMLVAMFAGMFFLAPIMLFNRGGIGASWLIWPFGPIALVIMFYEWKHWGKEVVKDPVFHLMVYALLLMWGFSPFVIGLMVNQRMGVDFALGLLIGVLMHLIPTIIGIAFAVVFRKTIKERIAAVREDRYENIYQRWVGDRILIGVMVALLALNVLVLALVGMGVIPYPG